MKSAMRLIGVSCASLVLLIGAASNGSASTLAPQFMLVNASSDKCLSVPAASTEFEYLNQFTCGGYPDQIWNLTYVLQVDNLHYYKIVNNNSGLCLSVDQASKENFARATQYPCGSPLYPDQYWRFDFDSVDNTRRIINRNSNKCLAIQDGSQDDTAAAIQFSCGTYSDHFWKAE
ncbi:RICIN domain-containing protein [Streptomyces sp. BE308]|nr:RICIN domain-containing protein [Streptomyces sp. BE308]